MIRRQDSEGILLHGEGLLNVLKWTVCWTPYFYLSVCLGGWGECAELFLLIHLFSRLQTTCLIFSVPILALFHSLYQSASFLFLLIFVSLFSYSLFPLFHALPFLFALLSSAFLRPRTHLPFPFFLFTPQPSPPPLRGSSEGRGGGRRAGVLKWSPAFLRHGSCRPDAAVPPSLPTCRYLPLLDTAAYLDSFSLL